MKKFIVLILFVLISCTKSEESSNNLLLSKIVGNWKVVGYYDDIEDSETGSNYHLVENGHVTTYKPDKTFDHIYSSTEVYYGNYSISMDSILTMNYSTTASGEPYLYKTKIFLLNDAVLEFASETSETWGMRFEKINTP